MKTVIVDLDSTLCDTAHRHHLTPVADSTKTWTDYSLACAEDSPIEGTIRLIELLHKGGNFIYILSSRMDAARPQTEVWLEKHGVYYDYLYLRDVADETHPTEYKINVLTELLKTNEIALMIDDAPDLCTAVTERLGILTVAPVVPQHYAAMPVGYTL